jgi:hypothetical protein
VKNFIGFITIGCVLLLAMFLGMQRSKSGDASAVSIEKKQAAIIPSVGSIQVLNGCGVPGAANKVADFLQAKGFDVKNKGNAPTSNYPYTIVISRKKDGTIARQVAQALATDKITLMRTSDESFDATVFVGSDFLERTK